MAVEWLKGKSAEQMHDARGWRFMWVNAVVMAIVAVGCVFIDLNALAVIMVGGAVGCAFVAGYSYRQRVLDLGEKPTWGFLILRDDPLLGEPSAPVPISEYAVAAAGRNRLRGRLVILHTIGVVVGIVLGLVLESAVVGIAIVAFSLFNLTLAALLLRDSTGT